MVTNTKYAPIDENNNLSTASFSETFKVDNNQTQSDYKLLKFPTYISSNRYPHYMMIYINVNSKSTLGKKNDGSVVIIDSTKTAGQGVGVVGTSTGTANTMINSINEASAEGSEMKPSLSTSDAGIKSILPDRFKSSKKRLLKAIMLPMPSKVMSSVSTEYATSGIGGILGAAMADIGNGQGTKALKDVAGGIVQNLPKHLVQIGGATIGALVGRAAQSSQLGTAAAFAVGATAVDNGFQDVMAKLSGLATNPRSEQIFKSVGPRRFQFDWLFAPKSAAESKNIQEIIMLLKSRMLPELDTTSGAVTSNGAFLIMPDEFDIEYMYYENENKSIGRIATSVLTDLHVDYSPMGSFSAFSGTGNAVMIQLSLQFTEVEPLIRNMAEMGF